MFRFLARLVHLQMVGCLVFDKNNLLSWTSLDFTKGQEE